MQKLFVQSDVKQKLANDPRTNIQQNLQTQINRHVFARRPKSPSKCFLSFALRKFQTAHWEDCLLDQKGVVRGADDVWSPQKSSCVIFKKPQKIPTENHVHVQKSFN